MPNGVMAPRGFTLTELLVTVAVAVLVLSFALPSFQGILAGNRSAAALNQMIGAVALGRSQAIVLRHTVTLCPARSLACLPRNHWHEGGMVFVDRNRDGQRQAGETVLRALPPLRQGERIYWRSFRNRGYLQFQPRGYTQWQNGSFLYCPEDNVAANARMAIVNAQGRVRVARDADADGIPEDARGRPLRCPP